MTSAIIWAEAEKLVVPPIKAYETWRELAKLVDGYAICEEIDVAWGERWKEKRALYKQSAQGNVVELLMMLWFEWGNIELGGNKEDFDFIDSIVHELARLSGQVM